MPKYWLKRLWFENELIYSTIIAAANNWSVETIEQMYIIDEAYYIPYKNDTKTHLFTHKTSGTMMIFPSLSGGQNLSL